jgi:hypothetical protein
MLQCEIFTAHTPTKNFNLRGEPRTSNQDTRGGERSAHPRRNGKQNLTRESSRRATRKESSRQHELISHPPVALPEHTGLVPISPYHFPRAIAPHSGKEHHESWPKPFPITRLIRVGYGKGFPDMLALRTGSSSSTRHGPYYCPTNWSLFTLNQGDRRP